MRNNRFELVEIVPIIIKWCSTPINGKNYVR